VTSRLGTEKSLTFFTMYKPILQTSIKKEGHAYLPVVEICSKTLPPASKKRETEKWEAAIIAVVADRKWGHGANFNDNKTSVVFFNHSYSISPEMFYNFFYHEYILCF
jgi:hypothetical protein